MLRLDPNRPGRLCYQHGGKTQASPLDLRVKRGRKGSVDSALIPRKLFVAQLMTKLVHMNPQQTLMAPGARCNPVPNVCCKYEKHMNGRRVPFRVYFSS